MQGHGHWINGQGAVRQVPEVQLGRLFQRGASAAREGFFNSRGEVTLAKEVKPDLGKEEGRRVQRMFEQKMWSPCSICKAIVKILYPDLSFLYNTIEGSSFGKSRLNLWMILEVFLSLLLLQYPVSSARKQRLNSLLGKSMRAISGADGVQWLHRGCWREQGCPASSPVLHQPPGSSAGRAAPMRSWLTPHCQLLLSGGCTTGDRYNMTTSLFLTDTEYPLCAIDIGGTSWTQTRNVPCNWEKGFRLLRLKV